MVIDAAEMTNSVVEANRSPCTESESQRPLCIMDKPSAGEENLTLASMLRNQKESIQAGKRKVGKKKTEMAQVRESGEGGSSTAIVVSAPPVEGGRKRGGDLVTENNPKRAKACKSDRFARISEKRNVSEGLRTRSSPKRLIELLETLNEHQKRAVSEIGFGHILHLAVKNIPSRLAYYLVDNYNHLSLSLSLPGAKLRITEREVHDTLGIPMGRRDVICDAWGARLTNELRLWQQQYKTEDKGEMKRKISSKKVIEKMRTQVDGGDDFKRNFMVLFVTCMIESGTDSYVNQTCFPSLVDVSQIHEFNWCKFLANKLAETKKTWKFQSETTRHFVGPITFLLLFYLDRVEVGISEVPRSWPSLIGWTTSMVNKRENDELEADGFGMGYIRLDAPARVMEEENVAQPPPPPPNVNTENERGEEEAVDPPAPNTPPFHSERGTAERIAERFRAAGNKVAEGFMEWHQLLVEGHIADPNTDSFRAMATLFGCLTGRKEAEEPVPNPEEMLLSQDSWFGLPGVWETIERLMETASRVDAGYKSGGQGPAAACTPPSFRLLSPSEKSDAEILTPCPAGCTQVSSPECDGVVRSLFPNDQAPIDDMAAGQPEQQKNRPADDEFDALGVASDIGKEACDMVVEHPIIERQASDTVAKDICLTVAVVPEPVVIADVNEVLEAADVQPQPLRVQYVEETINPAAAVSVMREPVGKQSNLGKAKLLESIVQRPTALPIKRATVDHVKEKAVAEPHPRKKAPARAASKRAPAAAKKGPVAAKRGAVTNKTSESSSRNNPSPPMITPSKQPGPRLIAPSSFVCSPYVERQTDYWSELDCTEELLNQWMLYNSQGDEVEFMYECGNRVITRGGMKSFKPDAYLEAEVVDGWCNYLNHLEGIKSPSSPNRFFFSSALSYTIWSHKRDDEFDSYFAFETKDFHFSWKKMDLVFMIVLKSEHYTVMCIDMKDGFVEIFDSKKSVISDEARYEGIHYKLRDKIANVISKEDRELGQRILNAPIDCVHVPWESKKNNKDCAIYAMWHMESYLGKGRWAGELAVDDEQQIETLRDRFMFKLLTFERNKCWPKTEKRVKDHFRRKGIKFIFTPKHKGLMHHDRRNG